MGSGSSAYACVIHCGGTNSWRATVAITCSTRSLALPRLRIWVSTISRRSSANLPAEPLPGGKEAIKTYSILGIANFSKGSHSASPTLTRFAFFVSVPPPARKVSDVPSNSGLQSRRQGRNASLDFLYGNGSGHFGKPGQRRGGSYEGCSGTDSDLHRHISCSYPGWFFCGGPSRSASFFRRTKW